jgi:hypothetical protein
MDAFLSKHKRRIAGTLSCVDRIVFKGYLPISWADSFESFLFRNECLIKDFQPFVQKLSAQVKETAEQAAEEAGRPYRYLNHHVRKEELVKQIAQEDGITEGLVCVLAATEACQSFRIAYGKGRPVLKNARRKCLCIYYYLIDPVFGLLHIRIQTWMPLNIQICMNGHEWLERQLIDHGVDYTKDGNCFSAIDDFEKAQSLSAGFENQNWPLVLAKLARHANPLLKTTLKGMHYYWVCDQMEYATDIVFKKPFPELYEKLLNHSIVRMGARDILTFLGKIFDGRFKGKQQNHCRKRQPGARVKHWMKRNWIKMYNKNSTVLRVETVINHPYDFRIYRSGRRSGKTINGWFPMSKCVANLYRYVEICLGANRRYLDALTSVDDPGPSRRELKELGTRVTRKGRAISGFNPAQPETAKLFKAVLNGDYMIQGFRNADIRESLFGTRVSAKRKKRLSAKVCRLFKKLHARGLIAKIPHSRRWRMTRKGHRVLGPLVEAYA